MVQQCACDCKIENCMTNIIEMKIIFKMIEYREKNKQPSLMMAIVVHVKISINKMKKISNKFRIVQSILAIENLNKLLKIVQLIRYFACRTHNDLV